MGGLTSKPVSWFIFVWAFAFGLTCTAYAQKPTTSPSQHVGFDSPEGWALKYFTSATLLSGLEPAETSLEQRHVGSMSLGIELGWFPTLGPDQTRVGFAGTKNEDLNKVPVFVRPVLRVGLPYRFTLIAAGTPPVDVFGVRPALFALGLERPIFERQQWRLGWRAYGQVGSIEGAFTCPHRALAFAPGSPGNPTGCVGQSNDAVTLRYAGGEVEFEHKIPRAPRLTPHVAAGVNFIDSKFQVKAPLVKVNDRTQLWTRGSTFSTTAGVSYRLTKRASFTVDMFYTPLGVRRDPAGPRTNDALLNVRALVSYTFW